MSSMVLFDEPSGFSANMKTFVDDHSVTLQSHDFAGVGKWITRAPMLALETPDPALQLPAQTTLSPQIFLRNTADRAVKAQMSFHWRSARADGRVQLPAMTLAPMETRVVDVKALQDKGTIPAEASWAQVTLTTNTLPNEVMAVAASFDETLRYGAQTPFSDQLAFHVEGAAWQVDQNHDSIIAVGNGGAKPVKARLTFSSANGSKKYQIERTIAPDDQMWTDVGTLIRNGVPDKDGNVLPSDLTTGAYQLRDLAETPSASLYEGKVVTDKTYGHATYGCMVCCGYRGVVFNPDAIYLGIGGFTGLEAEGVDSCGGSPLDPTNLDGYVNSWSSGDAAIMSVSPARAQGMSVGGTNAYATLTLIEGGPPRDGRSCPMQTLQVQAPGNVNNLTPVQHNYPNNPLSKACWITAYFDATRLTGAHHADDVVFDNGSGTGEQIPTVGTPVYAMEAGTFVATQSRQPKAPYPACMSATPRPPGDYVIIRTPDNYRTLYFHMTPIVTVGAMVATGQEIGTLDTSGCQSNPHLHVGRKDPNHNSVNFTIPCTNPNPTTKLDDGTTEDNDTDTW